MTAILLLKVAKLAAWILAGYVVTSALEYFPHRWVMHSPSFARRIRSPRLAEEFEAHSTLHHGRFFGPHSFDSCSDPAARYVSVDTGALYTLGKTWWIWLPLAAWSLTGGIVLASFLAAHGFLWTAAHREMHYPTGGWLSKRSLYRFWHRYHERHHEKPGTNFNVLLPLFDQLFGTYGGLTSQ